MSFVANWAYGKFRFVATPWSSSTSMCDANCIWEIAEASLEQLCSKSNKWFLISSATNPIKCSLCLWYTRPCLIFISSNATTINCHSSSWSILAYSCSCSVTPSWKPVQVECSECSLRACVQMVHCKKKWEFHTKYGVTGLSPHSHHI